MNDNLDMSFADRKALYEAFHKVTSEGYGGFTERQREGRAATVKATHLALAEAYLRESE